MKIREKKNVLHGEGEAANQGKYGCSASKWDIHHPKVQKTIILKILWESLDNYYLLGFYGKLNIFAKKTTFFSLNNPLISR